MSPYKVTQDFEAALCEYTGARYAVAVNSCTAALLLACEWYMVRRGGAWIRSNYDTLDAERLMFIIPKRTYKSVPDAIIRAGGRVLFEDKDWIGSYELGPCTGIWDSARRFTSGMYVSGTMQCVSFSASKILGAEQGGAILHDNPAADAWFRRMRFDGRTEGVDPHEDTFDLVGHHCLMIPSVAATLLVRLYHLPKHNADLPRVEYPDLSLHPAFK